MQFIDLITWYLAAQAFGIGGSLITRAWLRNLPDRGYAVGKAAGLLFGGFVYWITITLGLSGNTLGTALLALAAVWGIGLALNGSLGTLPSRRVNAVIVATEIIFGLSFGGWAYARAYSPEIIDAGGEKYMELMMINSILRAPSFPPNDGWLNGNPISYYYFGYVIIAMLIRVSTVTPTVAFNLAGALIFALAFTGAFGVGVNLWLARAKSATLTTAPLLAGLLTAASLTLMGNMGGALGVAKCANALPQSFWSYIDVRDIANSNDPCQNGAPIGWFDWWWDWSRVVKDTQPGGQPMEIISEFPIFSFVLGDNHPHVIALPFLLLTIALALSQFLYRGHAREDFKLSLTSFALNAIAIGSAGFMNTIDLPIAAAVFLLARLLGRHVRDEPLLMPALTGLATVVAGYVLFLPFHVTLSSQVQGIVPSVLNATRPAHFLLQFAPMVTAAILLIGLASREFALTPRALFGSAAKLTGSALLLCLFVLVMFGATSREARALVGEFQAGGAIMGMPRETVLSQIAMRFSNTGTAVLLAIVFAASAACLVRNSTGNASSQETPDATDISQADLSRPTGSPSAVSPDAFAMLLSALAAGLILAIEFVYIRDFFGTRMNSVFKFWFQAWLLWSIVIGYATTRLLTSATVLAKVGGVATLILIGAGLLFAVYAIPAKWAFARGFVQVPTWDGKATLGQSDDVKVIDWINANVAGNPVLVETPFGGSYNYRGRISTFTGLPAPIGWAGHEHQWRGVRDEADRRKADIDRLYSTNDPLEAKDLLDRYDVTYVIVGQTERQENNGARYPDEGLAKFEDLCSVAMTAGETKLYKCR